MKKLFTLLLVLAGFVFEMQAGGAEGRRIYVKVAHDSWHDAWSQGGLCLHVWGANSEGDLTGGWNNCNLTRIPATNWAYVQTNELPSSVNFIIFCKNADSWRVEGTSVDLRNNYIELGQSSTTIKNLSYSVIDATNKTILGSMTTTDNLSYTFDVDATASNLAVLFAPSFVSDFGFDNDSYLWKQCFRPYTDESSSGYGFENKTDQHFGIWNNSSDCWNLNERAKYIFAFEPNKLSGMTISPYYPATLNGSGYGTFGSFGSDFKVPTTDADGNDVRVYYAESASASGVKMSKVNAGTDVNSADGLFLIGEKNKTVKFTPASTTPSAISGNMLKPGDGTAKISSDGNNYYVFSGDAFKKLTTSVVVPVGKAYLYSTTAFARELTISFEDDETTSIRVIDTTNEAADNSAVYNVAGQRVANPTKGLYIVNGKKVLVK